MENFCADAQIHWSGIKKNPDSVQSRDQHKPEVLLKIGSYCINRAVPFFLVQ
jgi:hypothetical protein